MSLLEHEATRIPKRSPTTSICRWATSPEPRSADTDCWSATSIELSYEIGSHADYWDFLGYFAAGLRWPVKPWPAGELA